jgi:CO dehydrogenase maturation factor
MALKIAVSGKGGTGKTTVAAAMCLALAKEQFEVLALDCDPDSNLADALGYPREMLANMRPLAALKELIDERVGSEESGMLKLNPYVADIPDTHCHRHGNFRLMVMAGADKGGGGCDCRQSALMRRVVTEVLVRRNEAVILDMEAGLEHLGRATAKAVTAIVAVVEPGRRSVGAAVRIAELAADVEIPHTLVLGNRFDDEEHFRAFVGNDFPTEQLLGNIPFDDGIAQADRLGEGIEPYLSDTTRRAIKGVLATIEEKCRDL